MPLPTYSARRRPSLTADVAAFLDADDLLTRLAYGTFVACIGALSFFAVVGGGIQMVAFS